ncbi:MAG: hypothetical protein H0X39_05920 [Actinobacteria bacterium]|nr:hypothetical protein [Actinomycetota bacterium]
MLRPLLRLSLIGFVLLALAGCGGKGSAPGDGASTEPRFVVGAVEDSAKWAPDPGASMRQAHDSGFRAIVLSALWEPGTTPATLLPPLRRAVDAAAAAGIHPVLAVYQLSSATPTDPLARSAFAAFAAALARSLPDVGSVIVGNEPNINLFWQPQFGPDGSDAAADRFEPLLAETYDALKAVRGEIEVVGAGLAPRGGDDPTASRQTHSLTSFLRDLGRAYRESGRAKPIMDALSIHVYGETPKIPPSFTHPHSTSIGIADYRTLVHLLGAAFDGTAQRGSKLPILYGEYGVETTIPARKAGLYTGSEVVRTVDEATQARYYIDAIRLARRQPTVEGLYLFHVVDEQPLTGLQSGTRYADGTPKSSEAAVRAAAER